MQISPDGYCHHKACQDEQGTAGLQVLAVDDTKQQRRGQACCGGDKQTRDNQRDETPADDLEIIQHDPAPDSPRIATFISAVLRECHR